MVKRFMFFFFFFSSRRRHTRWNCDWSSDVCSSDLTVAALSISCQVIVQIMYSGGMTDAPHLRIGELSRRSGVSPELLRAWERRYGLLHPERSSGGLRLYSAGDLARVESMQRHLADGLAAAEAAALATGAAASEPASGREPAEARRALDAALTA